MNKYSIMICPVHDHVFMKRVEKGLISQQDMHVDRPWMYYCHVCNKYYFNTGSLPYDKKMKYKGKIAVNVDVREKNVFSTANVVPYDKKSKPKTCSNDGQILRFESQLYIEFQDGIDRRGFPGYYCNKCGIVYMNHMLHNKMMELHPDDFIRDGMGNGKRKRTKLSRTVIEESPVKKQEQTVKKRTLDTDSEAIRENKFFGPLEKAPEITGMPGFGNLHTINNVQKIETVHIQKQQDSEEKKVRIYKKPGEIRYGLDGEVPSVCECGATVSGEEEQVHVITLDDILPSVGHLCMECGLTYVTKTEINNLTNVGKDEFRIAFSNQKDLLLEMNLVSPQIQSDGQGKITLEEKGKISSRYGKKEKLIESLRMADERRTTDLVEEYLERYERLVENHQKDFPFSLLHYAIIFRRFDKVNEMLHRLSQEELIEALHIRGPKNYEWITPLVCIKWNINYIFLYDEKNNGRITEFAAPFLDEVEGIELISEYGNQIDPINGKNVFDVFFGNIQPVLDLIYDPKQELAAKQVEKHGASLVLSEMEIDRMVSAFYAIKDTIHQSNLNGEKARILILCPYVFRQEWQNEIRRHLGCFGHIVWLDDLSEMYSNQLKTVYFKQSEHHIFIAGQSRDHDKNSVGSAFKSSLDCWSNKEQWDLVVIDEAHNSYQNYGRIRGLRVMLMTSNPIVLEGEERRGFLAYKNLMTKVTRKKYEHIEIEPIGNSNITEEDIYVNWFREDMGRKAVNQKLQFITCKRHEARQEIFSRIEQLEGTLAAMEYDQDDGFLFQAAKNIYGIEDVPEIDTNFKIERLVNKLKSNTKSYVIYCEHNEVCDSVYREIRSIFSYDVVACKKGKLEEATGLMNGSGGRLFYGMSLAMKQGKRVLFITTASSKNAIRALRDFDGVIHYELPFTTMELEKRFENVDRTVMDYKNTNKEMIFMVNDCKKNQNDFEINRMIYYCMTKIDMNCRYMPVRNTSLYYPEFIKRNVKSIKESLLYFLDMEVFSIQMEKRMKSIFLELLRKQLKVVSDETWRHVDMSKKSFNEICQRMLEEENLGEVSKKCYRKISDYMSYWQSISEVIKEYEGAYHQFYLAEQITRNWLGIIGLCNLEDESVFTGVYQHEDGKADVIVHDHVKSFERELSDERFNFFEKGMFKDEKEVQEESVQIRIRKLIDELDDIELKQIRFKDFSSIGVYFYENGHIKRTSIDSYRNE